MLATDQDVRFPRLYAAIKWGIVGTLVMLGLVATAFWAMVLGGFAQGGFKAAKTLASEAESVVTPECAWPYRVNDPDARAVCRMFHNLTPQQREEVLRSRKATPSR